MLEYNIDKNSAISSLEAILVSDIDIGFYCVCNHKIVKKKMKLLKLG